MTRRTIARIAGFTFLFYIATGITSMVLSRRAMAGEGVGAKLAGMAGHITDLRLTVLLAFCMCFSALVLGVTLWALTRDEDPDLAMIGLVCRVAEGVIGGAGISGTLSLLWLATADGPTAPDPAAARTLAAYLLRNDVAITATFFAVGSTAFCWLFLRGRMIPLSLAWLGVVASVLLVVTLPLQAAGFLKGTITQVVWLPMATFEIPLGFWLMIKGVATHRNG